MSGAEFGQMMTGDKVKQDTRRIIGGGIAALLLFAAPAGAQPAPAKPAGAPAKTRPGTANPGAAAAATDNPALAMVPPAAAGVFTAKKTGANAFHLVVTGHKFTNRSDIEKYLAYRAAAQTFEQGDSWFTFVESRAKGETADPVPKPDPGAPRYSFRMKYFRPVWRFKINGAPAWTKWSPFTGAAFISDPKTIGDFEVSADIVLHKGPMDDANPLAFDSGAVLDLLASQVSPPS
jgi:hypothetical protein